MFHCQNNDYTTGFVNNMTNVSVHSENHPFIIQVNPLHLPLITSHNPDKVKMSVPVITALFTEVMNSRESYIRDESDVFNFGMMSLRCLTGISGEGRRSI